jgi:hypothetical protein
MTAARRPWYELDAAQLKTAMAHPITLGEELEQQPV